LRVELEPSFTRPSQQILTKTSPKMISQMQFLKVPPCSGTCIAQGFPFKAEALLRNAVVENTLAATLHLRRSSGYQSAPLQHQVAPVVKQQAKGLAKNPVLEVPGGAPTLMVEQMASPPRSRMAR
jgi:hypothetical protein